MTKLPWFTIQQAQHLIWNEWPAHTLKFLVGLYSFSVQFHHPIVAWITARSSSFLSLALHDGRDSVKQNLISSSTFVTTHVTTRKDHDTLFNTDLAIQIMQLHLALFHLPSNIADFRHITRLWRQTQNLYSYYSCKKFIPRYLIRGCRYCSINDTNELHLLVSMSFWVKKKTIATEDKSVRKTTVYSLELVCSYLCNNHYFIRTHGERHFALPCSKHVGMGITHIYYISNWN